MPHLGQAMEGSCSRLYSTWIWRMRCKALSMAFCVPTPRSTNSHRLWNSFCVASVLPRIGFAAAASTAFVFIVIPFLFCFLVFGLEIFPVAKDRHFFISLPALLHKVVSVIALRGFK